MNIQELGERLERELTKANIPYVESVIFDDFNDYEGRVFVKLKMETFRSTNGNLKYVFHDVNDKGILGKVTTSIRSVVAKNGGKIIRYVSPRKTYITSYGIKSPEGYDSDEIYFDFRKGREEVKEEPFYFSESQLDDKKNRKLEEFVK